MEKTPVEVLRVPGDERDIVEISSTLSIGDGFQVLLDNNVLSAPVYDSTEKVYVGFLDLRDLVSWAVFLFDEQENPADDELDLINLRSSSTSMPLAASLCHTWQGEILSVL